MFTYFLENRGKKTLSKRSIKHKCLQFEKVGLVEDVEQFSNVSDSQMSDTAVQRCEEILQAFIRVTGDETNWRQSRDPFQLPVQVLPLNVRQQVGFIQHQENSVCRNYYRTTSGTVGKRVCWWKLGYLWDKQHWYVCRTRLRMLLEGEDTLQVALEELSSLWCVRGEVSTVHNHKSQICLLQSERNNDQIHVKTHRVIVTARERERANTPNWLH